MTDDVAVWERLAALLPEAEAQEVKDCWDIGEQEAGLRQLVSGLLAHETPISETTRAQLSVLAEVWGEREALTPQILQCRRADQTACLKLIELDGGSAEAALAESGHDPADLVLVPWIVCARCGQVLMRAHTRESWGGLSYLAQHYVITKPDHASVLQMFPSGSASTAFAALQQECS
ncbi:hypothetical protein [Streptomyces sp. NPDC005374]|uniref:hypothetical protein n=1 Tax=Streptomyces sp. NPDC005374 TaxID=3364713 RepID=UPI0036BBC5F4